MKIRKIGIIGSGHVGSHVAFALATQGEVDELVLIDKDEKKAVAQSVDVMDAVSYLPHHVKAYQGSYQDLDDADVVVISAGPSAAAYEDRLEELEDTILEMKEIIPQLKATAFSGFVISISNPADVIATYLQQSLGYPTNKFICTGCVLDSARLQSHLASKITINRRSLLAFCLGEHGFSAMIPWSHVQVGGQPILDFLSREDQEHFDFEQVLQETKGTGYKILLGKGSTEFGIGSAAVEVIRSIFHDERKVLPTSVYLNGEYGQTGIYASVPTVIGKNGVEQIIEWQLTKEEQKDFDYSCSVIRQNVEKALKI